MRIALLTLEALANARAVRRFVAAHAGDIALIGLSDPFRPRTGGALGQTWRRLRASGPRLLPYLAANFALPALSGTVARSGTDTTPLRKAGAANGIPVTDVDDVNGDAFLRILASSGADLILTFHFDQILTAETIGAAPRGGINVHPSLLPRHRGPTPTIHALLETPVELGVSIHRLAPRIDAGAILAQVKVADRPGLTALRAAILAHEAALPLLDDLLPRLAAEDIPETSVALLPYRGFPTAAELSRLRRLGRKAADWADLRDALALSGRLGSIERDRPAR